MREIAKGDKFILEIGDVAVNHVMGETFYKVKDTEFALTNNMLRQLPKLNEESETYSNTQTVLQLIKNIAKLDKSELYELFDTEDLKEIISDKSYTELTDAWEQ